MATDIHDRALQAIGERLKTASAARHATDFSIRCGKREYRVDALLLQLHSDVLAKAVEGNFKEAHERSIDLTDDGEDCVDLRVHYLYHLDYDTKTRPMTRHVQMTIMADKYNIKLLHQLATSKLGEALQTLDIDVKDLVQAIQRTECERTESIHC